MLQAFGYARNMAASRQGQGQSATTKPRSRHLLRLHVAAD
ncbi:hypothetical protein Z945_2102 [Sulfitobacter noctilucae]|nr:hypothetical protein Z945_2102 [Sulfitobacter noctilucae]